MDKFVKYLFENKEKIVSFDFDDTIYKLAWDKENNDYVRDKRGDPIGSLNKEIAQKIKDYKVNGYKVYVLTTRYAIWRQETEDFLKDNNLWGYVDGVFFTNGAWKAQHAKKLGIQIHYDDDPGEIRRLKYKGIEGKLVKNEK